MTGYVITTRTDVHGDEMSVDVTGRTAVATLDEAREAIAAAVIGTSTAQAVIDDAWHTYAGSLPEDGGTITLPDGTVIEVKPVTPQKFASMLAVQVAGVVTAHDEQTLREQCARFNAIEARKAA